MNIALDIFDGKIHDRLHSFKLPSATPPIRALSFSPDGKWVAIASQGKQDFGELWLSDSQTGRMSNREPLKVPWFPRLIFRPDGSELIVCGHSPGGVQDESWFFDLHAIDAPPRREMKTRVLGFSRDGTSMVREIADPYGHRFEVVDLRNPSIATTILEPNIYQIGFAPGRGRMMTVSHPDTIGLGNIVRQRVNLWNPETGREILGLSQDLVSPHSMLGAYFSPDSHRLIVPSSQGELYLWDGQPLPEVWPAPSPIKAEPLPRAPAR
jgi:WD40 repeat protein